MKLELDFIEMVFFSGCFFTLGMIFYPLLISFLTPRKK
jgi:hypothetical protein